MEASLDLSIVLVNWNSLELTSEAIRTIKEKTRGIRYEIFVTDNGSTKDASRVEIPRRFPDIHFIANDKNRGFSQANNQGVRLAKGRYVVLLNNDTEQTENALGEAVRYMDAHEDLGALGIAHRNPDLSLQVSCFSFPRPMEDLLVLAGIRKSRQSPHRTEEGDVDWVCGSFLLMRRECLEKVGELDERFFIYCEDIDWCLRAHQAGWKIRFWPGVSMVHVGSAAKPFMRDKTFVHFRSTVTYLKKHYSWAHAGAYYLTMNVRLAFATTKQAALFLLGKANAKEVRERLDRQWQFFRLSPGRRGG